jgi:hypothetical protein
MEKMITNFHLTESEVIQGIALLRKVTSGHSEENDVELLVKNCGNLFIAAMIIAHKQSGDDRFKNKRWSILLSVSLSELNAAEVRILKGCDYRTIISGEECIQVVNHLGSTFKNFLQSSLLS